MTEAVVEDFILSCFFFFSVGFRQRSFSSQSNAQSSGKKVMPVFMVLCIFCKQDQTWSEGVVL